MSHRWYNAAGRIENPTSSRLRFRSIPSEPDTTPVSLHEPRASDDSSRSVIRGQLGYSRGEGVSTVTVSRYREFSVHSDGRIRGDESSDPSKYTKVSTESPSLERGNGRIISSGKATYPRRTTYDGLSKYIRRLFAFLFA